MPDRSEIRITPSLRRRIDELGDVGVSWLHDLPLRIEEYERAWKIQVGEALDQDGAVSWVAPAMQHDGSSAILKISTPDVEVLYEADALGCFDGRGAVRVLQRSEDGLGMLLERCIPGTTLWSQPEAERDRIGFDLLKRLWHEPFEANPFVAVSEMVPTWWESVSTLPDWQEYDAKLIDRAIGLSRDLIATEPCRVLLHGDFHPGNVLAAQREPWLVIDPKPLIGEPAFDLAQWIFNRTRDRKDPGDIKSLIEYAASDLNLDPNRIANWAFIKSVGWRSGSEIAQVLQQVASAM